jgi:hypothetical protein
VSSSSGWSGLQVAAVWAGLLLADAMVLAGCAAVVVAVAS